MGAPMKLVTAQQVMIHADDLVLPGELALPDALRGIVLLAHGSGRSRHSPRNRLVASMLHDADIGTLLFDLLTPEEGIGLTRRFDIALLCDRLSAATESIDAWQGSAIFDLVTSVRAPARPRPYVPPRRRRRIGASTPWCPEAGVLTWQDMTRSAASRLRC